MSLWAHSISKLPPGHAVRIDPSEKRAGHYLYLCHPPPGGGSYHVRYRRGHQPGLYPADRLLLERIYNEPENAFVADFIGDSNIIGATMVRDRLVEILGARFACVDEGFGENRPVDVVIRPEDVELAAPGRRHHSAELVTHLIFKGVHYEMEVTGKRISSGWFTPPKCMPVGTPVGIRVDPFNIQIMNKPESEDEEAGGDK